MATLIVHSWHTECSCGYGSGGWAAAAAGKDTPILTPDSTECPGCGEKFINTDTSNDRYEPRD